MTSMNDLPIAIVGGGPVGLAAAAHLIARGLPLRLYEAGDTVGANVRDWGHVRLFSPWGFNTDAAAGALLKGHGWQHPRKDAMPTGRELYAAYLAPLASLPEMAAIIATNARVRSIARHGIDKVVSRDRASRPFALAIEDRHGEVRIELARAIIDASGTWQTPNPLGAAGVPAVGEAAFKPYLAYGIPDVLGADHTAYLGKRVLVIGGGHSAANVLLDLDRLARSAGHIQIIWAVRGENLARIFGGGVADQLPARGQLGADLKGLVESAALRLVTGFSAEQLETDGDGLMLTGSTSRGVLTLGPVDRVIVATGQRPDLALTREIRLDLDAWLESPRALAPLIDPNLHSCGTVPPHGHRELAHPEPNFYVAGIKSYGRAPTFLMATGYEQVRSIVAHLAGDAAAANDVRLVLPETGVCSAASPRIGQDDQGCRGGPAPEAADACCVADHEAKQAGHSGCGCDVAA
jgi:thioredoxin reductase